jgi:cytochrome c-type biogenesis protein CcmH
MIWLLIVALALVVLLVLTMGFRGARGGWEAIASALVLGLAGYALQGHPGQPGAPHDAADKPNIFAATLVDERRKVVGATVQGSKWEMIADALMRHGDYADAAEVLRGAVDKDPRDSAAWLAMASALVGHAEGSLSPASLYAFRQAAKADPQAPGPAMFLGLALAGSGRFDEAHDMWATLLAKAPADAPWRKDLVARMARLDQIIAMTRAAQGARWAPSTRRPGSLNRLGCPSHGTLLIGGPLRKQRLFTGHQGIGPHERFGNAGTVGSMPCIAGCRRDFERTFPPPPRRAAQAGTGRAGGGFRRYRHFTALRHSGDHDGRASAAHRSAQHLWRDQPDLLDHGDGGDVEIRPAGAASGQQWRGGSLALLALINRKLPRCAARGCWWRAVCWQRRCSMPTRC